MARKELWYEDCKPLKKVSFWLFSRNMQISLQMGWNLALMIIFTCGTSEWHE